MTEYRKTYIKRPVVIPLEQNSNKHWDAFKTEVTCNEFSAITHISFANVLPFDFLASTSTRLQLYSSATSSMKRSFTRFTQPVYQAKFRHDGKLIVAGDGDGFVQVLDASSRAILRTLKGHKAPVQVVSFQTLGSGIFSASDDKSVRFWDMTTEKLVNVYTDHQDYVRTGIALENPSLFVTGSYDHTVKCFDLRSREKAIWSMSFNDPVQCVTAFSGDSILGIAAGCQVHVIDFAATRTMSILENHKKTVTSCCAGSIEEEKYLLSGSLDHLVKVYEMNTFTVRKTFSYSAPILSLAMSPGQSTLVAGMTNGMLSIRRQNNKSSITSSLKKPIEENSNIVVVSQTKRIKHPRYDTLIRKFQYREALDYAINNCDAVVAVSVIQELFCRSALDIAISGRIDRELVPYLRFIHNNIAKPDCTAVCCQFFGTIQEMYDYKLIIPDRTRRWIRKIRLLVWQIMRENESLQELKGMIEMVLTL